MKRILCAGLIIIAITGLVSSTFGNDLDKPLIIDVRTEEEWNNGHIEGAILIPHGLIYEKIGAVAQDKSQRIYVYCGTGGRSQIAKEVLDKLGYEDVINLGSLEDAARVLKLEVVK